MGRMQSPKHRIHIPASELSEQASPSCHVTAHSSLVHGWLGWGCAIPWGWRAVPGGWRVVGRCTRLCGAVARWRGPIARRRRCIPRGRRAIPRGRGPIAGGRVCIALWWRVVPGGRASVPCLRCCLGLAHGDHLHAGRLRAPQHTDQQITYSSCSLCRFTHANRQCAHNQFPDAHKLDACPDANASGIQAERGERNACTQPHARFPAHHGSRQGCRDGPGVLVALVHLHLVLRLHARAHPAHGMHSHAHNMNVAAIVARFVTPRNTVTGGRVC